MEKKRASLLLVPIALTLIGCATTRPDTSYLAKVNGEPVTAQDLKEEFRKRHGGHQRYLLASPIEIRKFLDSVIDQKLLVQEAYLIGLQDTPEIREKASELESRKAIAYLVDVEVKKKSGATDAEIDEVYGWKMDDMITVRQFVQDTRQDAEEARGKIRTLEEFEVIARDRSTAPSKIHGGMLPPIGWGMMDPDWEAVAFGLSPGEMSPVFRSPDGYEFLWLVSRDHVTKPDLDDKFRNRIKAILEKRKFQAREKEFLQFLRTKHHAHVAGEIPGVDLLKKAEEEKSQTPLATWDNGSITASSFASMLNVEKLTDLSAEEAKRTLTPILEGLVTDALLKKEAYERGYDKVPEVSGEVRSYREDLMVNRLHKEYILVNIQVTEEDLRAYYDNNANQFTTPERRKVAHIAVDNVDVANEVEKKLRGGAPFEDLVKAYSKDPETSKRHGVLGWFEKRQAPPGFVQIFETMKTGDVSDPISTDNNVYHIVKLLEIRPPELQEFTEVRPEVQKKAEAKKRREKIRFWVEKLRADSKVEINDAGIRAAVDPIDLPDGNK